MHKTEVIKICFQTKLPRGLPRDNPLGSLPPGRRGHLSSSRATMHNIRQNLFLTRVSWTSPAFRWRQTCSSFSAGMALSPVSVVSNAPRLRFFIPSRT